MEIDLTSKEKEDWLDYIEDFKNLVYEPIFKQYGFTLPEATMVWWLNRVNNNIIGLDETLENKDA